MKAVLNSCYCVEIKNPAYLWKSGFDPYRFHYYTHLRTHCLTALLGYLNAQLELKSTEISCNNVQY